MYKCSDLHALEIKQFPVFPSPLNLIADLLHKNRPSHNPLSECQLMYDILRPLIQPSYEWNGSNCALLLFGE
jgi:hypothetical protein